MISSIAFFLAAKWLFTVKIIAPIFEIHTRRTSKKKILSKLECLQKISFSEIAFQLVLTANRTLNSFADTRIFSFKYFTRLTIFGAFLGFVFSVFALLLIANDAPQAIRILQMEGWWRFVVFPSILTGAIFCPIDVGLAHTIFRWAIQKSPFSSILSLIAVTVTAYILWNVSAGVFGYLGFVLTTKVLMPSFLINRIAVAFNDPFGASTGMFSLGTTRISFSLLTASVALFSTSTSITFFVVCVFKYFPKCLKKAIAQILFALLSLLTTLERKKISYPITVIAWSGAIFFLILAVVLRFCGF